jgi:hypothetical protein
MREADILDDQEVTGIDIGPFGGLFGDGVDIGILNEIVADPYSNYSYKDLAELTGFTHNPVKRAVTNLVRIGLLENISKDRQHPLFRVRRSSKRLLALTLLSYGVIDDRDGTGCFDIAIDIYTSTQWTSMTRTSSWKFEEAELARSYSADRGFIERAIGKRPSEPGIRGELA